ncbi:hypothetical protein ATM17_15305 [Sphingopyxis macrogoltabida]|uniref:Uncharacterized protein n=1 Tax=Sphingopyxis macrogoltabida TaxID=33050 RepID=A0AAC9AVQ4_SPHMC|nr:hypothetical protein LH19_14725 [Sphingopyxis macrogoltabida]AMU90392.1 hypothetical protein ATM17_15305 [Sphingopyxis macrogoltabida]
MSLQSCRQGAVFEGNSALLKIPVFCGQFVKALLIIPANLASSRQSVASRTTGGRAIYWLSSQQGKK